MGERKRQRRPWGEARANALLGAGGGLLTWRSSPFVMWWLHQLGEQDRARIAAAGLQ